MPNIHDPVFTLSAKPPFRWGTSPFRARGTIYKEEIAVADKALGGRALDVVKIDPALAAFIAQPFSTLDWYDCVPIVYFGAAVARARGVSFSQHVRDVTFAHAAKALAGFSGVVLKLISNEAVATWLPRASAWYHDFGAAESKVVGPGHVRGYRTGMPHFMVQGWSLSAMTFTETVLAKVGAKEPRAHTLVAEQDGAKDGHPTYRIGFDVTWVI
jgi:hypothetical protein